MRINIEDIQIQYKWTKKEGTGKAEINHAQPKKIKILPYTTKKPITSFKGVSGDFARKAAGLVLLEDTKGKDEILDRVLENISNIPKERKIEIRDLFEELFFHEGEVYFSHPKILFNIDGRSSRDNKIFKELGGFLADIFTDEELKECFKKITQEDISKENVLLQIFLMSFDGLKEKDGKNTYKRIETPIIKSFKEDLKFLMNDSKMFVEEFENFLKMYYFLYLSQVSLKLGKLASGSSEDIEEIYFNLNWEKASRSRESYNKGWKVLERAALKLFSHRNCLEMLNHNSALKDGESADYIELNSIYEKLSLKEQEEAIDGLDKLIKWYRDAVGDGKWSKYKAPMIKGENQLQDKISDLFSSIEHQFKETLRKKPYGDYSKWFIDFAKENFLKRRGSLGYSLNLTQDHVFLLTKLAIKEREKLRLNELYSEFESRGIKLDRDSRESLMENFEKLNLLDKKSDSGDAIYVKTIL